MVVRVALQAALILGGAGLAAAQPAGTRQQGLVLSAPSGWQAAPARGAERGRWLLPGEKGQPRLVASLVRLAGKKQPIEEHARRWARAFAGTAREPVEPQTSKPQPLQIEGVPAEFVEVRGTLVAPPWPGAEEYEPRPGWVGLRALLEGPDGQWSVLLDGPAEAVAKVREAWLAFVKTAKVGLVETKDVDDEAPPEEGRQDRPGEGKQQE